MLVLVVVGVVNGPAEDSNLGACLSGPGAAYLTWIPRFFAAAFRASSRLLAVAFTDSGVLLAATSFFSWSTLAWTSVGVPMDCSWLVLAVTGLTHGVTALPSRARSSSASRMAATGDPSRPAAFRVAALSPRARWPSTTASRSVYRAIAAVRRACGVVLVVVDTKVSLVWWLTATLWLRRGGARFDPCLSSAHHGRSAHPVPGRRTRPVSASYPAPPRRRPADLPRVSRPPGHHPVPAPGGARDGSGRQRCPATSTPVRPGRDETPPPRARSPGGRDPRRPERAARLWEGGERGRPSGRRADDPGGADAGDSRGANPRGRREPRGERQAPAAARERRGAGQAGGAVLLHPPKYTTPRAEAEYLRGSKRVPSETPVTYRILCHSVGPARLLIVSKDQFLQVRVTMDQKRRIKIAAQARGWTVGQYVRMRVVKSLEEDEKTAATGKTLRVDD